MKLGYFFERVQHLNGTVMDEMRENGADFHRDMTEIELDQLERKQHGKRKQK